MACDSKNEIASRLDRVVNIQENLDNKAQDSTLIYLRQAQHLLDNTKNSPDSLQAKNNFLIGYYFKDIGRIDSAATYFRKATEYVKDSISNHVQVKYFQYTFNALKNLELYGECYSINQEFQALLDRDKFEYAMSWSLYLSLIHI